MLRFANAIRRGLSLLLKNGIFVAPRVQNPLALQPFHNQVQPVYFGKFFFAHWLQNASRIARFKCAGNPIQRMVANKRKLYPLFLAIAFTSKFNLRVRDDETTNSETYSPKEEHASLQDLLQVGVRDDETTNSETSSLEQEDAWLQDQLQIIAKDIPEKSEHHIGAKFEEDKVGERLGKASCNSAVYAYDKKYALKMLFNYSTDSQSASLMKAFSKELKVLSNDSERELMQEIDDTSKYTRLPGHFNVMKILRYFADNTPLLPGAVESYPAALPSHLYPEGSGRNRTLFYVMPKFSGTLEEYMEKHKDNISTQNSLPLLTQLLEGLLHLNKNGVAHRDLKSDNILVNETANGMPHLAITDFGCCLAEKHIGLQMPYETDETSKGGNCQLMAPEVVSAKPGPGKKIDYSKADEWAAGALAYKMFGQKNPFKNQNYKEIYSVDDLPELKGVPEAVQVLVKALLQRHPNDRPDISLAATVCQMLLWAPDLCMVNDQRRCLLDNIKRWFEHKTFTLTLEMSKYKNQEDIPVEKQILLSFLCRTSVDEILEGIVWLHRFLNET